MVVAAIVVTRQENRLQEMCADVGLNVSPFHNPSPSIGRNPTRQAVLWTVPLSDTEHRIGFHVEHNKPHGEMQPPLETGAGGHTHRLPIATRKKSIFTWSAPFSSLRRILPPLTCRSRGHWQALIRQRPLDSGLRIVSYSRVRQPPVPTH